MSADIDYARNRWSKFAAKEPDWINEGPKDLFDDRKRIRRETFIGMSTNFNASIEDLLERQARAYTIPRAGIHLVAALAMTYKCKFSI